MIRRLFVNMGNTALQWALEEDAQWVTNGRLGWDETDGVWRSLLWAASLPGPETLATVIGCVSSPQRLAALEAEATIRFRLFGRDFSGGVPVQYRDPRQLGADRLASATAAAHLHPLPAIIVSAGTCLTCEVVSAEGALVGGAIAPGLPVYLGGFAAAVPHLPAGQLDLTTLQQASVGPGQTTVENLAAGVCLSLSGTADAMARAMQVALSRDAETLILTGGDASLVEQHSSLQWTVEPLLTIEGLRIIHDGG